jgi:hypothetical protein
VSERAVINADARPTLYRFANLNRSAFLFRLTTIEIGVLSLLEVKRFT